MGDFFGIMDFVDEFRRIIDGEDYVNRNYLNADTRFTTYPSSKHVTDDGYAYVVPVPGLSRDDIKVSLVQEGKAFKIDGTVPTNPDHIAKGLWKFSQTSTVFKIPENANVDTLRARVENGLLKVTIQFKPKPSVPIRVITVE